MEINKNDELGVFQTIINELSSFEKETQIRLLKTILTFLKLEAEDIFGEHFQSHRSLGFNIPQEDSSESEIMEMSPKEFMLEKDPRNNIERIACLAYYLSHYRNSPHFKTLEVSKLNTEAAQPKFTNAVVHAKNAVKRGLLVSAEGKSRQLSAIGEQFVEALPDREAAQRILKRLSTQRRTRKATIRPK